MTLDVYRGRKTTMQQQQIRDVRIERNLRIWVSEYLFAIVIFGDLGVLYLYLLQNQSDYGLFNMGSLQRVWRCRSDQLSTG